MEVIKDNNKLLILYFRIPHNTLCFPGSIAFSQEHFKTISYAKFGGQTECIMGNSKIVNWDLETGDHGCLIDVTAK